MITKLPKNIILAIALTLILTLILLLLPLVLNGPKHTKQTNTNTIQVPTPIAAPGINHQQPYPTPTGTLPDALYVVRVVPDDGAQNTPLNQQILMTLNKDFSMGDITFFVSPEFKYTLTKENNSIHIIPQEALQPSMIYTYSININNQLPSKTYTFTTLGGATPSPVNTYENPAGRDTQYNIDNHPDIVLANNTPYSTSSFTIESNFTSTPNDHYYFSVTLTNTDKNASKQDFFSWARGLGLSDIQIQNLDIRYQ